MQVGCPKEIKPQEFRVGITPALAQDLVARGHSVTIEAGAGLGVGYSDVAYQNAGATIANTAAELFASSEMIVKVKEPQAVERKMLREGQLLFTYLHLAPDADQTHDLLASGCTAIAYETVTDALGGLPLLAPMSEVAGRLAPQMGAWTGYSSPAVTAELAAGADMIIGAVLIPGASAPKLITKDQLATLKPGAALVDVAIDQGGCFETSRATTHDNPVYDVDGIMHYCVANMPGAVARTATQALTNATSPFVIALADKGWMQACADDPHLLNGLNIHAGQVTYAAVGEALSLPTVAPSLQLKSAA